MKKQLGRTAPYLFIVLACGAAVYAISERRAELAVVLGHLGPLAVVASLLFGMLGTGVSFLLWRQLLLGLGVDQPRAGSFRVFFVGQLGKYLPGSVWPVVAQMEYGRRTGIARRTILAANALTLALSLAVGLILGAALLPLSSSSALRTFGWFYLFLPFLLALLHPRTIPGLLDWLFARIGRPPLGQRLSWSAMWRAAGWALLSWVLLGLHVYALSSGLGVAGPRVLAATIGGFALAASAGILFVPAPAGAGIRDVVLIATLGVSLTGAQALGVGLASRALLIVVDLLIAALAVLGSRLWPVWPVDGRILRPSRRAVATGESAATTLRDVPLTISVIGTGYLGVVHAACMADLGHTVIAIDTDLAKVESLSRGVPLIYEPGLKDLMASVLATGRLRFTTDYAEAAGADVHFICVGTPQRKGENAADTSYVFAAAQSLAPHLRAEALVVGKSTVPVGTAVRLLGRLQVGAPAGVTVRLAWNPEFLREGFAIEDTLSPDRFVYGVNGAHVEADVALLDEVYAGPLASGTPRIVTDYPTAELVKVAANAFLATKISFINAMAEVCEAAGADVVQLADAIGHDDRIGRKFLNAGVGFGGGCLPKDIRAFMARAGELGADQALTFLREIDAINLRQRSGMVDLAREECGGTLLGKRVAVLGAAFKPNSDDIRDSPALDVAEAARKAGAIVTVHDPKAMEAAKQVHPDLEYAETVENACIDADVVLHLTEWQQFREIDPARLASMVATPTIIDGRNALDHTLWRGAGWTYRAIGRPTEGRP